MMKTEVLFPDKTARMHQTLIFNQSRSPKMTTFFLHAKVVQAQGWQQSGNLQLSGYAHYIHFPQVTTDLYLHEFPLELCLDRKDFFSRISVLKRSSYKPGKFRFFFLINPSPLTAFPFRVLNPKHLIPNLSLFFFQHVRLRQLS